MVYQCSATAQRQQQNGHYILFSFLSVTPWVGFRDAYTPYTVSKSREHVWGHGRALQVKWATEHSPSDLWVFGKIKKSKTFSNCGFQIEKLLHFSVIPSKFLNFSWQNAKLHLWFHSFSSRESEIWIATTFFKNEKQNEMPKDSEWKVKLKYLRSRSRGEKIL